MFVTYFTAWVSAYRHSIETCWSLQRIWKGDWIIICSELLFVCLSHLNTILIPCLRTSADSFSWVKEGRKCIFLLRHCLLLNIACWKIIWILLMILWALWHCLFMDSGVHQLVTLDTRVSVRPYQQELLKTFVFSSAKCSLLGHTII